MPKKEDSRPVKYMERTRRYYRAMGYKKDYVWATFEDVPFAKLKGALSDTRIGFITTARLSDKSNILADRTKAVWSCDINTIPPNLVTEHLAWDKDSTHTEDQESFLPIDAARGQIKQGIFASPGVRLHGVPTEYSQRKTMEEDAPQILAGLQEDGADAAFLFPL